MARELVNYKDSILNNLNILMKIYDETLGLDLEQKQFGNIKTAGIKMALVTHANVVDKNKTGSTGW